MLASASDDCSIRLWSVASRSQTAVMEDSSSYVCSVVFSPCGSMLASGGGDKVVRCARDVDRVIDRVRTTTDACG